MDKNYSFKNTELIIRELIITKNAVTLLYSSLSRNFVQNFKADGQVVLVLALEERDNLWFSLILLRCDYALCLFVSIWYYYIGILSRSSRTKVFFKKLLLISQRFTRKHLCWSLFVSAASNFTKIETPAQVFFY